MTSSDSASFLVLKSPYSQDASTEFYDQHVKWDFFAQEYAFWGSVNKILHYDPIPPQKEILHNFLTGFGKFRLKKTLTMEMLTSKLPLIVIAAQWKLYV